MDDTLKRLEDLTMSEIRKVVDKGDMSPSELEVTGKAVCLLKEIGEYNQMHSMNGPMNDGYSGMRGRDAVTGRYMSRSDGMMSNGGYYVGEYGMMQPNQYRGSVVGNSYANTNGYSGHSIKDKMYKRMEEMLPEAQNEAEREIIQRYMREFMAE